MREEAIQNIDTHLLCVTIEKADAFYDAAKVA